LNISSNTVPAAGSEAMFRRVFSAGFQQARLSGRVNRGVLFFVIAFSQNLSIQKSLNSIVRLLYTETAGDVKTNESNENESNKNFSGLSSLGRLRK